MRLVKKARQVKVASTDAPDAFEDQGGGERKDRGGRREEGRTQRMGRRLSRGTSKTTGGLMGRYWMVLVEALR